MLKLRPYKPEYDQRVVELAREGKWWAQIALDLGITLLAFEAMIASQPSFAAAVEQADQACWECWWDKGAALVSDPDATRLDEQTWAAQMRVRFGHKAFRTGVRQPIDWSAGV